MYSKVHAHIHVCDFITILGFKFLFPLLSNKVLYNYSYRYWCLILLKYRYVLITMLFSIEFNKVFVFLHNCLTFHQCLEWSNSYNGTWSPKILQLSLSEDALDIYLRLTTPHHSVWWSILHVNILYICTCSVYK